jgi:hypothetical protein
LSSGADGIVEAAAKLRRVARRGSSAAQTADSLAAALGLWRDRAYPYRRETVELIAERRGFSIELLDRSIDALVEPFNAAALRSLADRVAPRPELFGFVMPGNVPGAGLHEVCATLIAGASVLVKTATAEPIFFEFFKRTLFDIDPKLHDRIAVFNWGRYEAMPTRILVENCDHLVVYGDDFTVGSFASAHPSFAAFGSRASAAAIAKEQASAKCLETAAAVARDATLFEQQGCLSVHHVFVEAARGDQGLIFAEALARKLEELAHELPPPGRLAIENATTLRRARESARWRGLSGELVRIWEGEGLSWCVIYDPGASFTVSPAFRTVCVSAVEDRSEIDGRLAPAQGRLEAFAVAGSDQFRQALAPSLRRLGVSYICEPGRMQSPPADWPHGDGALLNLLWRQR